ncbi:mitochondrial inner membrane protease subunit 2 isoform 3-T4 [Theristicus caerulescens]
MAQAQGLGKRYIKAFFKGFFVAVPVTVTFLDRVACVARVEGASMQPSLNPGGRKASDVVLLNHWSIRNYDVQRGDIVSLVTNLSLKAPFQEAIDRLPNCIRKLPESENAVETKGFVVYSHSKHTYCFSPAPTVTSYPSSVC